MAPIYPPSRASSPRPSSRLSYLQPDGRARAPAGHRDIPCLTPVRFKGAIVDVHRRPHVHIVDARHGINNVFLLAERKITNLHPEALCQVISFVGVGVTANDAPRDILSVAFFLPSALSAS